MIVLLDLGMAPQTRRQVSPQYVICAWRLDSAYLSDSFLITAFILKNLLGRAILQQFFTFRLLYEMLESSLGYRFRTRSIIERVVTRIFHRMMPTLLFFLTIGDTQVQAARWYGCWQRGKHNLMSPESSQRNTNSLIKMIGRRRPRPRTFFAFAAGGYV